MRFITKLVIAALLAVGAHQTLQGLNQLQLARQQVAEHRAEELRLNSFILDPAEAARMNAAALK